MTEQELEAISARVSAATPAPWGIYVPEGESPRICNLILGEEIDCTLAYMADEAEGDNAQFIADARTDVPALVAALREANAKIARMQKRIETVEVECNGAVEATKRVYAELRQANAKIIGLERAYH